MLTYQDFERQQSDRDKTLFLLKAIKEHKNSELYLNAVEAEKYLNGDNVEIKTRRKWTFTAAGKKQVSSKIITSDFFSRFVMQQNQYLLANGIEVGQQGKENKKEREKMKASLGTNFDLVLSRMGEKAIVHGVTYGFWNNDKLQCFPLASHDNSRGFVPLYDEQYGVLRAGIRFWQIDPKKPMYVQFYEEDGMTEFVSNDNSGTGKSVKVAELTEQTPKKAYRTTVRKDAISEEVIGEENYGILPIIPLYANEKKRTEFTPAIKSKIDTYDRIFSDFGDNLERTNDIYWVINNFGGDSEDVKAMLAEIHELKATYTAASDASSNATAQPHTIEVPYLARQTALNILKRELYSDYMALDMEELSGRSLTNVAIRIATTNLEMKSSQFKERILEFCKQLFAIIGIDTDNIQFSPKYIANEEEQMRMLQMSRLDFDLRTALEKNPMVDPDEIDEIIKRKTLEDTGVPPMDELEEEIEEKELDNITNE